MRLDEKLSSILRGNTCKGTNRLVIERLLEHSEEFDSLMDVPCGNGEFLNAVRDFFPGVSTTGADLISPSGAFIHRFIKFNGEKPPPATGERFNAITCISGVMEFDNTLAFFERMREMLAEKGVFIVTNDNILTVRDRLMYLFSGRFGQYPFRVERDGSAWKMIPAQNLVQVLVDAGFEIVRFEYVPVLGPNWLWIILALPLFLLQYAGGGTPLKRQIFCLRSFMSRHYVIVCHQAEVRAAGAVP